MGEGEGWRAQRDGVRGEVNKNGAGLRAYAVRNISSLPRSAQAKKTIVMMMVMMGVDVRAGVHWPHCSTEGGRRANGRGVNLRARNGRRLMRWHSSPDD